MTKVIRNNGEGDAYAYQVDLPAHVKLHNAFTANKVVPYRAGSK